MVSWDMISWSYDTFIIHQRCAAKTSCQFAACIGFINTANPTILMKNAIKPKRVFVVHRHTSTISRCQFAPLVYCRRRRSTSVDLDSKSEDGGRSRKNGVLGVTIVTLLHLHIHSRRNTKLPYPTFSR